MTNSAEHATGPYYTRLIGLGERLFANKWIAVMIIAVTHLVAALLAFNPTPQSGGDNAAYRSLAESLVSGEGYRRLWEPGHPLETLYPPVFPLMLAGAMRLGAHSFAVLQLLMVLWSTACVCAMYVWFRRTLRTHLAIACGIIAALSPGLLQMSHTLLSDVPFAAFTALALGMFASPGGTSVNRRLTLSIMIGAAAVVVSYFTRSAGLPLILATLGWLAWRRRYSGVALIAVVAGPLAVLWNIRNRAGGYSGFLRYVDPYQPERGRVDVVDIGARMFENLTHYTTQHLPSLLFGGHGGFAPIGGLCVMLLAIAGYLTRVRRPTVAEIWAPLYVGLLLLWPQVWSGERLLLPLYPLVLAYAAIAWVALYQRLSPPLVMTFGGASLLGLLVGDISVVRRGVECTSKYLSGVVDPCVDDGWDDYFRLSRALRGKLPRGSIVLSRKPTILYSLSGYQSVVFPLSSARDTLFAEAKRVGARYLVVDGSELTAVYVSPVLRAHPERFCTDARLHSNTVRLLRIESSSVALASSGAVNVAVATCASGR